VPDTVLVVCDLDECIIANALIDAGLRRCPEDYGFQICRKWRADQQYFLLNLAIMGRCPGLVWNGPLALKSMQRTFEAGD
jgi:hypothetical protein